MAKVSKRIARMTTHELHEERAYLMQTIRQFEGAGDEDFAAISRMSLIEVEAELGRRDAL